MMAVALVCTGASLPNRQLPISPMLDGRGVRCPSAPGACLSWRESRGDSGVSVDWGSPGASAPLHRGGRQHSAPGRQEQGHRGLVWLSLCRGHQRTGAPRVPSLHIGVQRSVGVPWQGMSSLCTRGLPCPTHVGEAIAAARHGPSGHLLGTRGTRGTLPHTSTLRVS